MKLLTHPAVTALGLTQLYLLASIARIESPSRLYLYHWSGTAALLFLPTVLLFCFVWSVLAALLLLARSMGRYGAVIWAALLLPVPLEIIRSWSTITGRNLDRESLAVVCGLVVAALAVMTMSGRPGVAQKLQSFRRIVDTMLGFVAVVALLSLANISWNAWEARNLAAVPVLHQRDLRQAAKPRMIWILFDELSYRQVYEQRYPGLRLPAFDQLAQQSTVFTSAIPAGNFTERIVPSLFSGQPVDLIRSSANGHQLFLHSPDSRSWVPFNPRQTVFADALNEGYSTAIAGWYNPYCRIMPDVLDQCFWNYSTPSAGAISPDYSMYDNIRLSLIHKVSFLRDLVDSLRNKPAFDREELQLHQLDYRLLSTASDRLLEDPSATFVFLHLPTPHPHGIYDRSTGQFATTQTTYFDDLALADKYLAHARALLERSGEWDTSTVIVMGDHSWRTNMWDKQPSWTAEEQRASQGGHFDPRPAYIVKLPHQHEAAHIDTAYAAIHTRAMLDAMMSNQIESPADLATWASQQQSSSSDDPASGQ